MASCKKSIDLSLKKTPHVPNKRTSRKSRNGRIFFRRSLPRENLRKTKTEIKEISLKKKRKMSFPINWRLKNQKHKKEKTQKI
jgi:hypothetical protein